ncbi:MAG TPA: hypothetical protein VLA71_00980 [Algoriphagus sp.]|nr:hypothetical protein [Algoriphagus sp.]
MSSFLKCAFLIALIFPTVSQVFASDSFVIQSNQYEFSPDENVLHLTETYTFSENPFGSNSPDPIPAGPEPDDEEKEEKEDSSDDDWKALFRASGNLKTSLEKVQTERLTQSLHNRKTIPFFILFHSWKSFFS